MISLLPIMYPPNLEMNELYRHYIASVRYPRLQQNAVGQKSYRISHTDWAGSACSLGSIWLTNANALSSCHLLSKIYGWRCLDSGGFVGCKLTKNPSILVLSSQQH